MARKELCPQGLEILESSMYPLFRHGVGMGERSQRAEAGLPSSTITSSPPFSGPKRPQIRPVMASAERGVQVGYTISGFLVYTHQDQGLRDGPATLSRGLPRYPSTPGCPAEGGEPAARDLPGRPRGPASAQGGLVYPPIPALPVTRPLAALLAPRAGRLVRLLELPESAPTTTQHTHTVKHPLPVPHRYPPGSPVHTYHAGGQAYAYHQHNDAVRVRRGERGKR